jgi:hypothetical protein
MWCTPELVYNAFFWILEGLFLSRDWHDSCLFYGVIRSIEEI